MKVSGKAALIFTGVSAATVIAAPVGAFLGELWSPRRVDPAADES